MRVADGQGHVFYFDFYLPADAQPNEQGIGLNDVCVIESIDRPVNTPFIWITSGDTTGSGKKYRAPLAVIKGQINPMPPELTADSEPNTDEWGPDNYWGPGTYITWHQLNKQVYGKATADAKMVNAIQQWGTGGVEFDYCYNDNFRNYFTGQGIDVSTLFCNVENAVSNVVDTGANITGAASGLTAVLKAAAPFVGIGALVYAVDKFVYPIFPRK